MKKLAVLAVLMALVTGCEAGECKCGEVLVNKRIAVSYFEPSERITFQTTKLTNWVTQLKPREQNWVQFGEVVEVKKVSVWLDHESRWLAVSYETNKLSDICRSYRVRPPKEPEYDFWGERVPRPGDDAFREGQLGLGLTFDPHTSTLISALTNTHNIIISQ